MYSCNNPIERLVDFFIWITYKYQFQISISIANNFQNWSKVWVKKKKRKSVFGLFDAVRQKELNPGS